MDGQVLIQAMADLDEEVVLRWVRQRLEAGDDPLDILADCRQGMAVAGARFEREKYFLAELIMAAEVFKGALTLLEPHLIVGTEHGGTVGEVVFGTVEGDIHDIGKDLVVGFLRAHGFEVYDLGVDVPPDAFVNELEETGARVLGLSGLITPAFDGMKATVEALVQAGLRARVKVMIGGGLVDERTCRYVAADAWGKDAVEAVELARRLSEGLE